MKSNTGPNDRYAQYTDAEIWNLIVASDLEALSYVYKKYYSNLYNFGLKCSRDHQLTEDCIQDLFIKLWDKRSSIAIRYTIKSYLMTSLRRMVLDKLAVIRKEIFKANELPDGHEPGLSVQDLLIQKEMNEDQKKKLDQSLNLLTKKQKEIVYLRFYQEMSYDEIAEMLNIKYQSVRNCIYESMKSIKDSLAAIPLIMEIFSRL